MSQVYASLARYPRRREDGLRAGRAGVRGCRPLPDPGSSPTRSGSRCAIAGAIWFLLDRTTLGPPDVRRRRQCGGVRATPASIPGGSASSRSRCAASARPRRASSRPPAPPPRTPRRPRPGCCQSIAGVFLGMAMFRGGRPNLPGTVLGVILLRVIDNGLNFTDINDYIQSAISGLVIVIAVLPPAIARLRGVPLTGRPPDRRSPRRTRTTLLPSCPRSRAAARPPGDRRTRTMRNQQRIGRDGRAERLSRAWRSRSPPHRTGRPPSRRPHRRQTGAGKTIAIITPDYANQPAAKEAIDALQGGRSSRAATRPRWSTRTATTPPSTARSTTAIAQEVDAIVDRVRRRPRQFGEGLAAAGAAGTPVFGLDTGGVVEPDARQRDHRQRVPRRDRTAQAIIDALGGEGKVAMITFDPFEPVASAAEAATGAVRRGRHRGRRVRPGRPGRPDRTSPRPPTLDWLVEVPRRASSTPSGPAGTRQRWAPTRRPRRPTVPRSS